MDIAAYSIVIDTVEKIGQDEHQIYTKPFQQKILENGFSVVDAIYIGLSMRSSGEGLGRDFVIVARRKEPLEHEPRDIIEASRPEFMEYRAFSGDTISGHGWGAPFLNTIIAKNSGMLPADILEAAGLQA